MFPVVEKLDWPKTGDTVYYTPDGKPVACKTISTRHVSRYSSNWLAPAHHKTTGELMYWVLCSGAPDISLTGTWTSKVL